jgi:serine O-acetyltransferase
MFQGLVAYLDSVKARDPAPRSRWEILLYPGVWALGLHRVAHWLFKGELFFLARLINHLSRFLTAIDIHPGARSGAISSSITVLS